MLYNSYACVITSFSNSVHVCICCQNIQGICVCHHCKLQSWTNRILFTSYESEFETLNYRHMCFQAAKYMCMYRSWYIFIYNFTSIWLSFQFFRIKWETCSKLFIGRLRCLILCSQIAFGVIVSSHVECAQYVLHQM